MTGIRVERGDFIVTPLIYYTKLLGDLYFYDRSQKNLPYSLGVPNSTAFFRPAR